MSSHRARADCQHTKVEGKAVDLQHMNVGCGNSTTHCVINHPTFINVFWDEDEDRWNKDIKATDQYATVKRIDAALQAIVRSAYMWPLQQYYVTSPTMKHYIVEGHCGSVPATADDAWNQLDKFVTCVHDHHPEVDTSTILNVFVPPRSTGSTSTDFCNPNGGGPGARHRMVGPNIAATLVPTNTNCSCDLREIVGTTTHEMAEAATDPNPQGITGFREIGDVCEHDPIYRTEFLFGQTHAYWSNVKMGCTNGVELVTPYTPAINQSTSSVCGTGHDMRFEIRGNLTTAPWDLEHNERGGDRTLFLHARVGGSHDWSAGQFRAFDPDVVGLGKIEWSDDRILVHGFDDGYGSSVPKSGAFVSPGDSIEFTVGSWATGQTSTITFKAPAPKTVDGFKVSGRPWPVIGSQPSVTGRLVDGGSCGIGDANLTIRYGAVVPSTNPHGLNNYTEHKLTAFEDGRFNDSWTLTGAPGKRSVDLLKPVAQHWTVEVHPDAKTLSSALGDSAGGRTVTLDGAGFVKNATTVAILNGVVSTPATNVNVVSDTQISFVTPKQAGAADVTVVATVNLLDSSPLSYRYITPLVPDLHAWAASCKQGDLDTFVEVDLYDKDGTPQNGNVTLTSTAGTFGGGATSTIVAAGNSVRVRGGATITAVSGKAEKSASITPPAVTAPLPFCPLNSHIYKVYATYTAAGGPIESIVLPAVVADDGTGISWSSDGGVSALATKLDSATLARARTMVVQTVSSDTLAASVRDRPPLLATGPGKSLRLVGPALSVGAPSSGAAPPLTVTLALPTERAAASQRIVHRAANGAWSVQTARLLSSRQGSKLQASVSEPGLYALAAVE